MGLFNNKNPNESAYFEGKKHFTDVIKNTGPADMLIWRQPEEDFNNNSTLIVMPGEEAIFINCGVVENTFEKGTYTLSTENYPFISRLRNSTTGGISTFNCVVYFVRKADSGEIPWGTDTPIQVRDKVWGVRTEARVRGAYKFRIVNSVRFLEKLIGSKANLQNQNDISKYFRNEFQGKIKAVVSRHLNDLQQELIGIEAYIDEISEKIEPYIDEALESYGLKCVKFALSGLDIDKTKYDRLDESQMRLIEETKGYQGDKAGIDILGKDWDKVHRYKTVNNMIENQTPGSFSSFGAELGIGLGTAGVFSDIVKQSITPTPDSGTDAGAAENDPMEALTRLKKMLDAGLIEQSDYDAKKAEILSRM